MSIADQITRLQGVKSDIIEAIKGKGVDVPMDATLADCPNLISTISGSSSKWSSNVDPSSFVFLTYFNNFNTADRVDRPIVGSPYVLPKVSGNYTIDEINELDVFRCGRSYCFSLATNQDGNSPQYKPYTLEFGKTYTIELLVNALSNFWSYFSPYPGIVFYIRNYNTANCIGFWIDNSKVTITRNNGMVVSNTWTTFTGWKDPRASLYNKRDQHFAAIVNTETGLAKLYLNGNLCFEISGLLSYGTDVNVEYNPYYASTDPGNSIDRLFKCWNITQFSVREGDFSSGDSFPQVTEKYYDYSLPTAKIGNNNYPYVKIGNLYWLTKNLSEDIDGNQPFYNDNESQYKSEGRYYTGIEGWTWDGRNPDNKTGWRLPTLDEWRNLVSLSGSWNSLLEDPDFQLRLTGEYTGGWNGINSKIRMQYQSERIPVDGTYVAYSDNLSTNSVYNVGWTSSYRSPIRLVKDA